MFNLILLGDKLTINPVLEILNQNNFKKFINFKIFVTNKKVFNRVFLEKKKESAFYISNSIKNEKKIINLIKKKEINLLFSVQHRWVISKKIINLIGKKNCFNLHNAKLPNYKGYNPITHALINKETRYHSSIHFLTDSIDSGDIAIQNKFKITKIETAHSLYLKSIKNLKPLVKNFFIGLKDNKLQKLKQKNKGKFYKKSDIKIYQDVTNINDINKKKLYVRACFFPLYKSYAFEKIKNRKYLFNKI